MKLSEVPGSCNYLVPFFQFLTAHTGVELPDNRTEVFESVQCGRA